MLIVIHCKLLCALYIQYTFQLGARKKIIQIAFLISAQMNGVESLNHNVYMTSTSQEKSIIGYALSLPMPQRCVADRPGELLVYPNFQNKMLEKLRYVYMHIYC